MKKYLMMCMTFLVLGGFSLSNSILVQAIEKDENVVINISEQETENADVAEGEMLEHTLTDNTDEEIVSKAINSGTYDNGLSWEMTDGVLTISGSGIIDGILDEQKDEVVKIVISEGITGIGRGAFMRCSQLKEVSIPEGVIKIESWAFAYCANLAEVIIPSSVKEISHWLFGYCSGLQTVYFRGEAPELVSTGDTEFDHDGLFPFISSAVTVYYPYEAENYTEETELAYYPSGSGNWVPYSTLKIMLEATDDTYTIGSSQGAKITCNGKLGDFVSVSIDGNEVDKGNYSSEKGSTVINFKTQYLDTLVPGKHVVTLNYTYDSVDAELTVISVEQDDKIPLKIIPEATDNVYVIGSETEVTIKCTGELKDFVSMYMDGEEVDRSNYTLSEGSTILTFAAKYLDALSIGKHRVTLNYTYDSVNTELTILSNENSTNEEKKPSNIENVSNVSNEGGAEGNAVSPNTGDRSLIIRWILLSVASAGICAAVLIKKKVSI